MDSETFFFLYFLVSNLENDRFMLKSFWFFEQLIIFWMGKEGRRECGGFLVKLGTKFVGKF